MPVQSEFIGLKQANAALRQLPVLVRPNVQQVQDVTAFHVARDAAFAAPRSADGSHGHPAGFLKASIQWKSRSATLSSVVGVAVAAFYWKFLEFGTRYLSARPFFRPAADKNRVDHHTRLIAALDRSANEMARLSRG